tara:strand:- start:1084 stop:1938 length:855 start_codon:yes stop_codon:yes gene_type:complete
LSRNSNRQGAPEGPPAPLPQAQAQQTQNLFSFPTPTEFVELPSKGLFYGEGHPLQGVETIEIKHMTAKEEDILSSETLIKKGLVMNRLLKSVLVDTSIDPNTLLIGDKNAIIMTIRETGFGSSYATNINCPACGTLNEKVFSLEGKQIKESNLLENVELLENGNFLLTSTDYNPEITFEIKLLTGKDEQRILKHVEGRKKLKLETGSVTELLKNIIISVNGITQPSALQEIIGQIPAALSRKIRKVYEEAMPNIELKADFTCDNCSHTECLEVPINVDFFWPKL